MVYQSASKTFKEDDAGQCELYSLMTTGLACCVDVEAMQLCSLTAVVCVLTVAKWLAALQMSHLNEYTLTSLYKAWQEELLDVPVEGGELLIEVVGLAAVTFQKLIMLISKQHLSKLWQHHTCSLEDIVHGCLWVRLLRHSMMRCFQKLSKPIIAHGQHGPLVQMASTR